MRVKTKMLIGDSVEIATGHNKGFRGKFTSFLKKGRVLVVNDNTKVSVHISNVVSIDQDGNKAKIKYKFVNGDKVRYFYTPGSE